MNELFGNIGLGISIALQLDNLLFCFVGVLLGTLVGVLPGIGALATISMLLPLTFYMDPIPAIVMLAGVYYGSEYGGSIASILLHLPGSASNAITCLDGYPMAQQGRAGVALLITALASFVGGLIGIGVLVAFAPVLADVATSMQSPEYFAIMVFGLIAAAGVSQGAPLKALAMVVLGLLLGTIGTDAQSGESRFILGFNDLYDGISLVILAMGLFGVTEVIVSLTTELEKRSAFRVTLASMMPTSQDIRMSAWPTLRGTAIGSAVGALPGTGAAIATFISYALEKRLAKDPTRFGKGAIEGIASPEASNNAAAQTAFIPTLAMGVPGSAAMAVMLGALMLHGITPGPALMAQHPEMFWGLVVSFLIGNVMLLILNIPLIGLWVRILYVPYNVLMPIVIVIVCIGVYSTNYSPFDLFLLVVLGGFGYLLRQYGFQAAPLILAFILGPLLEENLRRTMLLSRGDALVMLQRPISGTLLAISAVIIALMLYATVKQTLAERRQRAAARADAGKLV